MRRIFVDKIKSKIVLDGDDAHHIGYALRARVGDSVTVADASGDVATMRVSSFTRDTVTLELVARDDGAAHRESPVRITLAMCLPKSDKMDMIVQKATELGVTQIQPLESANCVVKYDEKKRKAKREKWQKIAEEAAKQCARTKIPRVNEIVSFGDFIKNVQSATVLHVALCYESEKTLTIKDWLREKSPNDGERYTVIVGAEGGFTPSEAAEAESVGIASVTLGPRILRCETAAIAALSIVQYEKGDL